MMDLEFIERLIEAVDASGLDSIELERGGTRIRLSKTPPPAAVPVAAAPAAAGEPAPAAAAGPAEQPASGKDVPDAAKSNLVDVPSPMVGTFFRAPAPDAPPYVEVGSRVAEGETLCIIEAMKLMNELESEVAGTVAEICVENAQPVEYGQLLFRIEPS